MFTLIRITLFERYYMPTLGVTEVTSYLTSQQILNTARKCHLYIDPPVLKQNKYLLENSLKIPITIPQRFKHVRWTGNTIQTKYNTIQSKYTIQYKLSSIQSKYTIQYNTIQSKHTIQDNTIQSKYTIQYNPSTILYNPSTQYNLIQVYNTIQSKYTIGRN